MGDDGREGIWEKKEKGVGGKRGKGGGKDGRRRKRKRRKEKGRPWMRALRRMGNGNWCRENGRIRM